MNLTSGIRRAALVRPRGLAIVQGMQRISWREVSERVARIAGGLQELGVEPGDRVATLAVNAPGYYELLMAIWWVGRPSPGADEGGAQALREWGIAP